MEMARAASRRSTCFRLNVGALVVHENNPVAAGWNGQQPGSATLRGEYLSRYHSGELRYHTC